MQPLGIKPNRFPNKIDWHPPKGYINWWEAEIITKNPKTKHKQIVEKQIREEIGELK